MSKKAYADTVEGTFVEPGHDVAPTTDRERLHKVLENDTLCTGLDDGPWLPGYGPRKVVTKSPEEMKAIRAKAWLTRRKRYGERGHA